ncbi:MAG: nucleotidyltransferase family protein [Agriterribacter sp.]
MLPVNEAIILAGGLGTRLRSAVPDLPKCMAPVNGKPFIAYVTAYLQQQGIQHFIFALGYKSEAFDSFLREFLPDHNYTLSVEDEPLGTGGAIQLASNQAKNDNVMVTNGDTIFKADLATCTAFHFNQNAECTLALKPMHDFDRYGVVMVNEEGVIDEFKEKQYFKEGLINGGLYVLNTAKFKRRQFPQKFSFEKDYLEKYSSEKKFFGIEQDGYFIDIGIPEDYNRAQHELSINHKP